jgi:hypothetical protein
MAKEPYSKGRGRCIFCGAYGLTREHMWADWLRAYIPRTMTEHHYRSVLMYPEGEEVSLKRQTGDPHSRRIKCVCEPCNTGWMSRLQEDTKPFLVPMLTGTSMGLHRRAQTILAAWIAMTAMVAEFSNPERLGILQADRDWLQTHRTAPAHWRIWLGRQSRRHTHMYWHNVLTFTADQKVERVPRSFVPEGNTQSTTICLGQHLLIHVMSSEIARRIIRLWRLPSQTRRGLSQIWPIKSGVVWPPSSGFIFNDLGVRFLADEFYNRVTNDARLRGLV